VSTTDDEDRYPGFKGRRLLASLPHTTKKKKAPTIRRDQKSQRGGGENNEGDGEEEGSEESDGSSDSSSVASFTRGFDGDCDDLISDGGGENPDKIGEKHKNDQAVHSNGCPNGQKRTSGNNETVTAEALWQKALCQQQQKMNPSSSAYVIGGDLRAQNSSQVS
jgi:hypothetical protein